MENKVSTDKLLLDNKQYIKSIETFIDEIIKAEHRIVVKQCDIRRQRTAIFLYKESILIRELFTNIAKYFNLESQLSNEQYIIVKRVWNKAFEAAVDASKHIHNESIIKNIEKKAIHELAK